MGVFVQSELSADNTSDIKSLINKSCADNCL